MALSATRWLPLAAALAMFARPAEASWLFEQVSPHGEGGGWTNRIVQDAAGTEILFRTLANQHMLYELSDDGQQHIGLSDGLTADLATGPYRLRVGMARVSYDPLDGRRDLELVERSAPGRWSADVIETDLGPNGGATALAYDPDGNPWIVYGRVAAGALITRRDAAGQWHSVTIDSSVSGTVDLAFDPMGRPHVLTPAQHLWLDNDVWHKEQLPLPGPASVGQGLSFDRQGRAYVATVSGSDDDYLQIYRRDEESWAPIPESRVSYPDLSDSALALDAADRPHMAAVAWDFGRFLVLHRWFNGAVWRQETVAGWASNTSGPQAASLLIDDDNVIHVPFNTTKNSSAYGGDLYHAQTLGTPLGAPIMIEASYDLRAEGSPGGDWTFTDGDRQVALRKRSDDTETRMLLSFDLSRLPQGAQVVGAELDLQQNGNPGINLSNVRAVLGHAFADDGLPDGADVEINPEHRQVGFLGSATPSRFDDDSLAVMRLSPSVIASIAEADATHLGMSLTVGDGPTASPIRTIEEAQADILGQWTPPRLWLYVRLPGDFNLDGVVDAADLQAWTVSADVDARADGDRDGDSDGADFLLWQRQIGSSVNATTSSAASTAVPEPASLLLAICMLACAAVKPRISGIHSPSRSAASPSYSLLNQQQTSARRHRRSPPPQRPC